MGKKILLFSLLLSLFFHLSCKPISNCILDMNFERMTEGPGPDLITFNITSNEMDFEKYIEEYGLIEVIFNENKSFKTKVFGIIKTKNDFYELKISTPYFSLIKYTDEGVYSLFNESKDMIINITLKDKTFVFKKC